ncbi:MAG: hypothetical protein R2710_28585, partial [Acidimicrobiales bacterium]
MARTRTLRPLSAVRSHGRRIAAVAASVGLATGGLSLVSAPVSAEAPTGCGAVGAAGVIPITFPNPTGATINQTTTTVGATATYANVGTVDGVSIDARATLDAISG